MLQSIISTGINHFKGKVYAWVELYAPPFSTTPWGEGFVATAFNTTRSADSNAKLYINDYKLDSASYAKTTGMSYLSSGGPGTAGALTALCSAASECAVTELGIASALSSDYANIVNSCEGISNSVGMTVWGVRDTDSWRASSTPLLSDAN
ncbi:glycoside hydrolase family 10 protein [Lepidopterella palustris CBS 459.81]|uniref:Glycoside hydrolase family 10 protein n=1 Tax=Lepidopterella palustris CBS 459.81 TaxID=1314670 RepID=A0A8E2ELC2_9PEZI|nr:glycoside hydrolase family 10 protein [Lepidopterella palustris CBS 459.81]